MVYGQSLLLAGMAASLAECPGLEVTRATTWAGACRRMAGQPPDVLIFDLTNACESQILPLLFKHSGLLLIGMDTESNQAVVVSGQGARSLTLQQMREMVGAGGDAEAARHGDTETGGHGDLEITR